MHDGSLELLRELRAEHTGPAVAHPCSTLARAAGYTADMSKHPALIALIALLHACGDKAEEPENDDTAEVVDARAEGEDTSVTVFDGEYVHFGDENKRVVDIEVELPDDTVTFESITGHFALRCPNNNACDWWDRYGNFGIVLNAGSEEEQFIELDRFITAYRVGMEWESDLTAYRPLLTDTVTLRVFIDTWVSEGHENGDGWLVDVELEFEGGPPPSPEPVAVVPVWGHLSWKAGQPSNPVEDQVVPTTVDLPEHTEATFRSFITGHGWNNSQNCAEFCSKEHFYTVAGEQFSRDVWREDCKDTVTDGTQQGTWRYSRAGWCPGAQVYPWDTDVTEAVDSAGSAEVSYALEDFEWLGDGDEPYYYMSGVLLLAK